MVREILKINDKRLKALSSEVLEEETDKIPGWVADLHDTLMAHREKYGTGRAITLPQIGIPKRVVYAYLDKPYVFINPLIDPVDDETCKAEDECLCHPGYTLEVQRHKRVVWSYVDEDFRQETVVLEGEYAELMQHQYEHLIGLTMDIKVKNKGDYQEGHIDRSLDPESFPPLHVVDGPLRSLRYEIKK